MRGAIAAGHPLTAAAGAAVLEAGGNAVDACVAAAFMSWVCESMLTGPGGGGFMLVHHGGGTVVFDAFVTVPQTVSESELFELAVDFDGDTQQVFHTGPGAVAVPGTARGLEAAHRRFGSVDWASLAAPAVAAARAGVELTPAQGYLHRILDGLLRHSPEGDRDVRRARAARGRAVRAPGSRRDARADRGGGRGRAVRGRDRGGDLRARAADARGSRGVRGRRARAGVGALPREASSGRTRSRRAAGA